MNLKQIIHTSIQNQHLDNLDLLTDYTHQHMTQTQNYNEDETWPKNEDFQQALEIAKTHIYAIHK